MQGAFPCSRYTVQEAKVIRQTLAGAAFATPALAQAVIEDPGYCAQFYPNANCQNLGPGNPYTDGGYYRDNWPNGYAMAVHHPRHSASSPLTHVRKSGYRFFEKIMLKQNDRAG